MLCQMLPCQLVILTTNTQHNKHLLIITRCYTSTCPIMHFTHNSLLRDVSISQLPPNPGHHYILWHHSFPWYDGLLCLCCLKSIVEPQHLCTAKVFLKTKREKKVFTEHFVPVDVPSLGTFVLHFSLYYIYRQKLLFFNITSLKIIGPLGYKKRNEREIGWWLL